MKPKIIYIEHKIGSSHNGDAWIGRCSYSKTGLTIYFNGNVYKKEQGFRSNFFDIETGEEYWISGVKRDGNDRHRFGSGIINIDESVIDEYLKIVGETALQKNKFHIVQLDNIPAKHKSIEIENEKSERDFDYKTIYKNPKNLTDDELNNLILHYEDQDLSQMFKKGRRIFKENKNNLQLELDRRNLKFA